MAFTINEGGEDVVKKMVHCDRPVLMLYHMTMCPHCQILKPTWEKVKRKLKINKGIAIAEVEFSNMNMLPAHLRNIRGFPTIQMIENGKIKQEYAGDRSLSDITDFALKHAKPVKEEPAKKKAKTSRAKTAVRKT